MRLFAVPFLVAATLSAQTTIALPASTYANGIQVDSAGNIYIAGDYFASPSDPNAPAHAFVAKLSPDGSQTLWRTNLAGSGDDRAVALALGPSGAVYVTGNTASTDFPVSKSPYSQSGGGFAVELNSSGAVVFSTLIPVSTGQAIVVDSSGDAYITGAVSSGQAFTPTPGAVSGLPSSAPNQYGTGYLLELDPTGSKALLGILGFGGGQIALDSQGNIYLAGSFVNQLSVTTPGAFQPSFTPAVCFSGLFVAGPCTYQHIAKIDPTGKKLLYATYLNGVYGATPNGLVVDSSGNAILAGSTASPDYPTTPDAFQPEYSANPSVEMSGPSESAPPSIGYITKLNATGTALVWSTFLGGSGDAAIGAFTSGDSILGLALDSAGNILVAGEANSSDFPGLWTVPVASRPTVTINVSPPGFAARLTPDGTTLSPVQLFPNFLRDLGDPTGGAIVATAGPASSPQPSRRSAGFT
jgi:hypothetical protein